MIPCDFMCLCICYSYIVIFLKVLTSAKKMSGTESAVSGSVDELALAKKLVIIVATDFACWVSVE